MEVRGEDTIVIDNVSEAAWEAFQMNRAAGRLAPPALHVKHWQRSRRLGASPEGRRVDDALVRGEAFRLRSEHVELLQALGAAALSQAAAEVSSHDFVLLMADADGMIVRSAGGGGFRDEAQRVRLMEGAEWSEAARGTNAIGTAAAELRPTIVMGRGHYGRSYHELACYAAPITDPHGRLVGVLDATSRLDRANPAVGQAVFSASSVLSELLRLEAFASAGGSVLRVLKSTMDRTHEAMILVEAPGRVSRLNAAARIALGGVPAGGSTRPLLGLGWESLVEESLSPTAGGRELTRGQATGLRLRAEPVLDGSGLPLAVCVTLEVPRRRPSNRPPAPAADDAFGTLFAQDPTLLDAIEWARLVARSDLPVMLLAETGSGKELFVRAIHEASDRAQGPFVAVNCGAIAPTLLESELFGHAAGAFTGADPRGREGLFHAASGGTLFLDEVAEMPLAMQAALLRVLDSGAFHRVGDHRHEQRSDVRVVCATCRDLEAAVDRGDFRQDLFYRLRGASVRLPALRDRADILGLAEHLVAKRSQRLGWPAPPRIQPDAAELLRRHAWPGNVRELLSVLDVALLTARGRGATALEARDLPRELRAPRDDDGDRGALRDAEAAALERALTAHGGNVSAAARELGVARSTVYRLARRLGISTKKRGR
ncbi:MAG: sigma-54-dependent Fis family transcriptional regulator [Sandaracinus sp.]|nr:sigma-54-dependent Fis family transcriptional regulator [Sandaracinus sp.]